MRKNGGGSNARLFRCVLTGEVLEKPGASDHMNIRNFMRYG